MPIDTKVAYNERHKKRIQEAITNLGNLGTIPAEEVQLNIDTLYNSIADQFCAVVETNSPHQVISALRLVYGSASKSMVNGPAIDDGKGQKEVDALNMALMNGVSVPLDDGGYPTKYVKCSIIPDDEGNFLAPFHGIVPGTIKIGDENKPKYFDDGLGSILEASDNKVGDIDYFTGVFSFTETISAQTMTYEYDIYNLVAATPTAQFQKVFVETFAEMFHLSLDSALSLYEIKKSNNKYDVKAWIESILPQVLSQQIDQHIISKYFKQAQNQILGSWDASATWEGKTRAPVSLLYEDLGTFVSVKTGEFARAHGINPNIIICSPLGFGLLSSSKKFQPITNEPDDKFDNAGTPKVVGWFNNMKVILSNQQVGYDDVNLVLTFKGPSEAQAACVYTPFIPVNLYSQAAAYNGFVQQNDAYSLGGVTMVNPELVAGIVITNKDE